MNRKGSKKILFGLLVSVLVVAFFTVSTSAESSGIKSKQADSTEGGNLETDFGANFMAEWWYLNGKATLVSSDDEKKDVGFFVVLGHQESPLFRGYSHMLSFYGIYSSDSETDFNYIETYVPRTDIDQYIALHTPYVDYKYPVGLKIMNGSAVAGYYLKYLSDNKKVDMNLFFQTNVDKTIDRADQPLSFTTYEHSYGTLHGSILLDGKRYKISRAEGYLDHMIPVSTRPWPMDMHGWSWIEVTTKNYQVVAYAVRGIGDGYGDYSYKHLTLLNKNNGKVLAEYSGNEIKIIETDWITESKFNRKRPSEVVFSTPDLIVSVNAESVIDFNRSNPASATGFVDFMAFQQDDAKIQYTGDKKNNDDDKKDDNTEKGSAFYEYLVSDAGVTK